MTDYTKLAADERARINRSKARLHPQSRRQTQDSIIRDEKLVSAIDDLLKERDRLRAVLEQIELRTKPNGDWADFAVNSFAKVALLAKS